MPKNKKDYLCSCYKITKSDVKNHIKNGITDYKELQKITKIGSSCSDCKKKTKKKFYKYVEKLSTE